MPRAAPAKRQELALDENAARVLRRFRIVFNSVRSHFRQVERKAGIAGAQLWALSVIQQHPGIGVTQLAHAMDVHQSTASNLLRPLVQDGLVAADRAETDRRALRLHVTPAGTRVLRKAPGPFAGVLPQALLQLDRRTLRRLEADLGTLIEVLGADEKAGGLPLGRPEP